MEMNLPDFNTLICDTPADAVLRVTLNRPEAANAFNTQKGLRAEPGDVRVVVLTGSGDRAFCAGGDLKERDGMSDEAWFAQHLVYERMVRALLGLPLPVIGAVKVRLGIIPGAGGTQLVARAVGERRAKQLIMSGEPFSAEQAGEWGLVNEVVAPDKLMERVLEIAKTIASNAQRH